MELPRQIPGLRAVTIVVVIVVLGWMTLEGSLRGVLVTGAVIAAVLLLHGLQRFGGNRHYSVTGWLVGSAALGLVWGMGSVALALVLMVLKTGIHAHGPEFTVAEISTLWQFVPLGAIAGLLAGTGLGLLALVASRYRTTGN